MPVSFSRLRIAGFKSFAEPATIEILPGLTGVVGPNGCGKSNVVEALRWAMGESSAHRLRGGEMDDVIFAGSAARPSRNIAEVTLNLADIEGRAPPPFHQQPELEISRRVERGSGSSYRINGREVRARDIQTLFADLASGAQSSAMVSQGRVGSIVMARPESRRAILEEAAGTTGLRARRHEAELKLRAAEANLSRSDDLKAQLEGQLANLKRQARQASRYRNISGALRQAETELFAIQRARADRTRAAARASLSEAQAAVSSAAEAAVGARAIVASADAELPARRQSESDARTALERLRIAGEQLEVEAERARHMLEQARQRFAQVCSDLSAAERTRNGGVSARALLDEDEAKIVSAGANYPEKLAAATAELDAASDSVRQAEIATTKATEAAADASARAQAIALQLSQTEQRAKRTSEQLERLTQEHAKLSREVVDPERLKIAEAQQLEARNRAAQANETLQAAEQALVAAHAELKAARERQSAADSRKARLKAEVQALAEILAVKDDEEWPSMVDALRVPSGLEAALGAVLGEELTSAADPAAPRHWRELPHVEGATALPGDAVAISTFIQTPAVLARSLSHIGLIDDEADGDTAQRSLRPGQALVTRAGAVWRWDGYTVRAGTPTAATVRLQQRNRLALLKTELEQADAAAATNRASLQAAEELEKRAAADEAAARARRRQVEDGAERARATAAELRAHAAAAAARIQAVEQQLARSRPEADEASEAMARVREASAALPDVAALKKIVEASRIALSAARSWEASCRSAQNDLVRDHDAGTRRLASIAKDREHWVARLREAEDRLLELTRRRAEAEAEQAMLQATPDLLAGRRIEAARQLEAATAAHKEAAETLASAVAVRSQAEQASRTADAVLSKVREEAARAEGAVEQAEQAWAAVSERILERLGPSPTLPDPTSDLSAEAAEKARRKLERLSRERDEMGPVNLRAEIECEEIEKQIATIVSERDELSSAIAKLRGSIGLLNREGRERLTAVFQEIDGHFQMLFARMFGGGRAQLALVGSDDPLEAGLEIYAQPPGKKLATLSLLSGGEQALTALSLIFAIFRCNPAPICVLDEVDAPLDDANVERFCNLLDDMVKQTGTRFMVITHHHLTMARMDRLYGVTMQERGVSRLLSVDLQAAEDLVEPPRVAAE